MASHPSQAVDVRHADPCEELVVERGPDEKGVGSWVPNVKHRLICDWLIGTRHAWKKWDNRIFIDPFAGPNRIQVEGESFTRDGGSMIAWRQSQLTGAPFTKILVGDIDSARSDASFKRLSAAGAPVKAYVGSAKDTVRSMYGEVPGGKTLALVYIDPYNLRFLSFEIIECLARLKHVDFLVHFSTNDLQRNVELEMGARAGFDETAPGWRNKITAVSGNKAALRLAFFEYWRSLIQGIGFSFSRAMPLVKDDDNTPLYRLIVFSRHELPKRVWEDVARGENRELF